MRKRDSKYYLDKSKKLLKEKKFDKATEVLNSALIYFEYDYKVHHMLAEIATQQENWSQAVKHWNELFKLKREISVEEYVKLGKAYRLNHQLDKSDLILTEGLQDFPDKVSLIIELAETKMHLKKWKSAANLWDKVYKYKKNNTFRVYLRSAIAYRKIRDFNNAKLALCYGEKKKPKSKKLLMEYVYLAIAMKNWKEAVEEIERCLKHLDNEKLILNMQVKLSMIYRILGKKEKAEEVFDGVLKQYGKVIQKDNSMYKKIIIFDNGESRIEFYKRLSKTERVIITFDSINMTWKSHPFAFKLLKKQNLDIIAVRKREKNTHLQDLSFENFIESVNILVSCYEDKMAYGFSLGAYATLYYAGELNCRILAISPRLSIHPLLGKTKMMSKENFKHEVSLKKNNSIDPIIVFDPKNKLDNSYVQKGVLTAFPNAVKVEIPYGGHGMAPHLLEMGILKEFVLTFINEKKAFKYESSLRKKSYLYYRVLADTCLKRNKPKWALYLVNYAIELNSNDELSMQLKIRVMKQLKHLSEALEYAIDCSNKAPDNEIIKSLLIDIYIEKGDMNKAEDEIALYLQKFGETKTMLRKLEEIQNAKKTFLS